jgi:membrane protease YdiL (CAAX protease family)
MKTDAKPMPKIVPAWKRWLTQSRFGRVLIFVAMFFALISVVHLLTLALGWLEPDAPSALLILAVMLHYLVPSLGAYLLLVYGVERRVPRELEARKTVPHGASGLLFGGGFMALVFGVLWLAGVYRVGGLGTDVHWAAGLFLAGVGPAVAEEIVFRGIAFRLFEERWGTWRALAFSSAMFGLAHITNPGATLWSSAAIMLEAGVLLGLVFKLTRSLPACMGVHAGWNFVQGTVFGGTVSGAIQPKHSLFIGEFSGPDWLTGGRFGVEASAVTVVLSLAVSAAMIYYSRPKPKLPVQNPDEVETGMSPC